VEIKTFSFNPFQVNCYLIYNESGKCIIVDASCYEESEKEELSSFMESKNLTPVMLLNTHGHVDHIPGNFHFSGQYSIPIAMHKDDLFLIENAVEHGSFFGFEISKPPEPTIFPIHGDTISLGSKKLEVRHAPGHSPGSVLYYSPDDKFVITGDVIFSGSIGRTDLPGGDYDVLMNSIRKQILTLPDDTVIYPGHGPYTTVKAEKLRNPFLK
jgi:hydroxyacylglutathione hydrolase